MGGGQDRRRAVIFDFDGTIADSLPAVIAVFEDLTGQPKKFGPKQVNKLRALSLPELLVELKVPKWRVPLLLFRGRRMLRKHLTGIPVHAGMPIMLEMLQAQGILMYILSSNSTENVREYLRWHKLSQYFSGVYGGASLVGKAPRLLKLIEKEGLETKNSWYVGDETRDVSAARAVGLHIVSVTWGFNTRKALAAKKPDALADTAEDLLQILKDAWKK